MQNHFAYTGAQIDFARLVRKYQIERPAGEILCGPFDKSQITKVSHGDNDQSA